MVAIESKDDLYVIDLLEDFDEFYLELEHFAEENRVPIIDKIGIRFLIQMLKIKKAKNLLEIGTAIGYTSIKLAEKIGCNVTTIERDDKMYNEAKKNIEKRNLNDKITLLHADALELQDEVIKNAPYDIVLLMAQRVKVGSFLNYMNHIFLMMLLLLQIMFFLKEW